MSGLHCRLYMVNMGYYILDKELARVRSKFVDKVSKEIISQLLDDILEDGVVNDGEKDRILEENNSRADKARSLIDAVKRKGDKASAKMIARLQNRDPTLYSELGLSCCQPSPPGEIQTGITQACTLKEGHHFKQKYFVVSSCRAPKGAGMVNYAHPNY